MKHNKILDDLKATLIFSRGSKACNLAEIFRDHEEVLNSISRKIASKAPKYSSAKPVSLRRVYSRKYLNQPVKFIAGVTRIETPTFAILNDDSSTRKKFGTVVRFDDSQVSVASTAVTDPKLLQKVLGKIKQQGPMYILGTPVEMPCSKARSEVKVLIHDIRNIASAINILNPSGEELEAVRKFVVERT